MGRHLCRRLGPFAVALALILPGCQRSSPEVSDRGRLPSTATERIASLAADPDSRQAGSANGSVLASRSPSRLPRYEDLAPWPHEAFSDSEPSVVDPYPDAEMLDADSTLSFEALHDPDPNARMGALEAWGLDPGESLDPLTYALVEPDGSVRARAEELLEEELDRR